MVELKKPLDYSSQIKRLRDFHKLTIGDEKEALLILQSINYYRLSGYGIGLTEQNNHDEYRQGVSLRDLYDLYQFDSVLKNTLLHFIEQIEIELRTKIAYCLSVKYGSDGYYEPKNFSSKIDNNHNLIHTRVIHQFEKEVENNKSLPFVKHHLDKYEGKFPIWVAVELFSFGQLSSLYSIMESVDRKEIAKQYNCAPRYLGVWIQLLVEVRNICAHYGRLYNLPLRHQPPLPQEYRAFCQFKAQTKIFPVVLVLKLLLKSNSQWASFYAILKKLLRNYHHVVRLSFMGFPPDWEDVLSK